MAEFLRQYNPNVQVFPNQIFELPEKKIVTNDGIVRLFFAALNRQEDWRPLMPSLNRVLQDLKVKLHVTVIHDKDFFDELNSIFVRDDKVYFFAKHCYRISQIGADGTTRVLEKEQQRTSFFSSIWAL